MQNAVMKHELSEAQRVVSFTPAWYLSESRVVEVCVVSLEIFASLKDNQSTFGNSDIMLKFSTQTLAIFSMQFHWDFECVLP